MDVQSVSSVEEWASAIVALPVASPLPARTVLVPSERVAHRLRSTLIARGAGQVLVGTRFTTVRALALSVVAEAGESTLVNEAELARLVVRDALAEVALERFRRVDLLTLPGWDEALARTLAELEAAEVSVAALLASDDAHVRDVGRVLAHVAEDEALRTRGALLRRATKSVRTSLAADPLLAVLTGHESAAELTFVRALPNVVWARWLVRPAQPARHPQDAGMEGAADHARVQRVDAPRPLAPAATALAQLQTSLFAQPPSEPAPVDATVRIVTYAGVHEEVEAAVGWVVEQVVTHALPLAEIALLAPTVEVYGPLLRARLAALPWSETGELGTPVYSEGGVPLLERADGARVLQVLRALRAGLSRDALAPILPNLRGVAEARDAARERSAEARDPARERSVEAREPGHVHGLSRAWELLNAVAVLGGERGNLRAGRSWPEAWEAAALRLELPADDDDGEALASQREDGELARNDLAASQPAARERAQRRALHRDLTSLTSAIEALTDVLRHVVADEPLSMVWMCLSTFVQRHLRLPPAQPSACSLIDVAAAAFVGHEEREPRGVAALAWLEQCVRTCTVERGRYGEPAIYVGSLASVRGLSFRALRVLGLSEGALPSVVREDPVRPDAARRALSPLLSTTRARAERQLSAFDDAIRGARERLVLSAPRTTQEGSTRQPAAVLLDVLRALAGSAHASGLEQRLDDAARLGRAEERAARERLALSPAARLERIGRRDHALAQADHGPACTLSALHALAKHGEASVQDGLLAGPLPASASAGLAATLPISASRLATLLSCPHRHLYENVLGMREPTGPLPSHALPANVFGSWLHDIAESFWRANGAGMSAHERDFGRYRADLRAHASARFAELAPSYPFANTRIAEAQREALCDQLDKLLELDEGTARAFVDVERAFGYDAPCALATDAGALYVRGRIDKLDRDGDALLVRDIKTGAAKPRKLGEPPELGIDLQLGVYARVAQRAAAAWGTPERVGVAYLYLRGGEPERAWIGEDYAALEQATGGWLAAAVETLRAAAFVRTADPDDCRFCAHRPVCEPERARAPAVLRDPRVPRRLAVLKGGDTS